LSLNRSKVLSSLKASQTSMTRRCVQGLATSKNGSKSHCSDGSVVPIVGATVLTWMPKTTNTQVIGSAGLRPCNLLKGCADPDPEMLADGTSMDSTSSQSMSIVHRKREQKH